MITHHSTSFLEVQNIELKAPLGFDYLLSDISFFLAKGDRLGILGPSGSGKTTLLKLLNRLIDPSQGKIFLEGSPINTYPILQLRRQVNLLLQEPKLLNMTVQETLAYPLTLQKIPKNQINPLIETWCKRVGIPPEWLERNELQLSLGQRQLVTIARSLILNPKLLLLDEPTSALDVGSASAILTLLTQLTEKENLTFIMVNHQLEWIKEFCTHVLYLQKGKLIRFQPVKEVRWQELRQELIDFEKEGFAEDW